MSCETVDVVEGQIVTASGLLQWIQAEAEKTRRAVSVSPLLIGLTYLLGSIISNIEKMGVENYDPEHAGHASGKFLEVSEEIRLLIARSDASGLYERFPSSTLLKKVRIQGKVFAQIAQSLNAIDEKWQVKVTKAAQDQIDLAHQLALTAPEETIELFDAPEDLSDSPSVEAIRAQFHRAAALHHKTN